MRARDPGSRKALMLLCYWDSMLLCYYNSLGSVGVLSDLSYLSDKWSPGLRPPPPPGFPPWGPGPPARSCGAPPDTQKEWF